MSRLGTVSSTVPIPKLLSLSPHKYNYEHSSASPCAEPLRHRTVKPHNYSLVVKSAAYAAVTASHRLTVPCALTTCYQNACICDRGLVWEDVCQWMATSCRCLIPPSLFLGDCLLFSKILFRRWFKTIFKITSISDLSYIFINSKFIFNAS